MIKYGVQIISSSKPLMHLHPVRKSNNKGENNSLSDELITVLSNGARRKDGPSVSVIIPSLDGYREGNIPKLLEDLNKQTFQDFEVIIVQGVSPTSRSHNVGVQNASTGIIVFFDDDIILGNNNIIDNLIKPVIKDKSIGITGASQLIPTDANWFQKKCSKEFSRFQFPIVSEMVESDMATHAAMAIRKEVFIEIGQENENLIYGDDPDLRHRVRQAGYKIVIVPHTWIYHPPPKNLTGFLRIAFRRGQGSAHDFWHHPESVFETPPANSTTCPVRKNTNRDKDISCSLNHNEELSNGLKMQQKLATAFVPKRTFLYRILRFFSQNINAIVNLKLIFLSVRISYGLGYSIGLLKEMLEISPPPNKH
jgi:glycosyltransferase involved in cell wall biosynthesis